MMVRSSLQSACVTLRSSEEGENIQLDALRALQYEGTRAEIAQGFKDRGNECMAEKSWADAREFYSRGLSVLAAKDDQWEKPKDFALEVKRRKQLEEILRVNRAMAQLELSPPCSTFLDIALT